MPKSTDAELFDGAVILPNDVPVLAMAIGWDIRCVRCGQQPAIGWDAQSGRAICYLCASQPLQEMDT